MKNILMRRIFYVSIVTIIGISVFGILLNETTQNNSNVETSANSNDSALPIVASQKQYGVTSFEGVVKAEPITVLATVQSIETKMIDESRYSGAFIVDEDFNITGQTEQVWEEYHVPYLFVTLRVDEYIKDSTGQFLDTIVVKTKGTGEGTYRGEQRFYTYDTENDFPIGKTAMYSINVFSENDFRIDSHTAIFHIFDDGTIQSDYMQEFLKLHRISDSQIKQIEAGTLTTLNNEPIDNAILESLSNSIR